MLRLATVAVCCTACGLTACAQTFEFISDHPPTPASHASSIVELEGGDVLAAWFGGSREGAPDVAIWSSRRDAHAWSEPKELVLLCYKQTI